MIQGLVLNPGEASGAVRVLTEPVSFWGAYDPRSGKIIDQHHPQSGVYLGGQILLLPETRGSGGTPGGIAEAIRRETAPAGIILITPDINLAVGARVAVRLYQKQCPVLSVAQHDYERLALCREIMIHSDGAISTSL